jgi:hypothetical protein
MATAQGLKPVVVDARLLQSRGEVFLVELRELAGAGETPDVHQSFDVVL